MKKITNSFIIIFFCFYSSFSQVKKDSLTYYEALTKKPPQKISLVKAYSFYSEYYKKQLTNKDTLKIIYSLSYLARIERKLEFFGESEKTITQILELIEKKKNKSKYLNILRKDAFNQLGMIYRKKGNILKALNLYSKSLQYSESATDSAAIYNNISNIYKDNKNYFEAKKNLIKAINLSESFKQTLLHARILDNLGFSKFKLNKKQGKKELDMALAIRKEKNHFPSIYSSYKNLTHYYKQINKNDEAKDYANKARLIAKSINRPSYLKNSIELLIETNGNQLSKEYQLIVDTIIKRNQKAKNEYALLKYNVAEQTKKTQEAELNAEKEKQRSLMFQLIGVFIALLAIAGYFIHKAINKKKIVENVIETEGRISKTVHDVVANDVYHIITKIQTGLHSKEELLDDLDVVYQKARKIAHETFVIDNEINFGELLNDLCNSYKSASVNIITNNLKAMHWESVSIHKKNMLYRVLQELMTNMTKYSKATLVTLNFKEKGKQISIIYKDNGIGTHLIKKNGLINAENRIKSVGGSIIFESAQEKGFKTLITI